MGHEDDVRAVLMVVVMTSHVIWQVCCVQHQGLYSRHVRDFELTVPQKITPGGLPLGTNLTHHHTKRPRPKRDLSTDTVHYRLNISGRPYILDLEPSSTFVSPVLRVQRGATYKKLSSLKANCHYRGVVRGFNHSSVAMSACHGLAGVMRVDNAEYWLEPSTVESSASGHPHIVFRRAAATRHRRKKKKKRKKKHEKNCGTKERLRQRSGVAKGLRSSGGGNGGGGGRFPRSVSRERHVETLLVADSSMVEFHQDGDVETYLLTVMNMVSALYQEPSIGNSISIVVVSIILVEDDAAEGLNVTVNADRTLSSFCRWQQKHNPLSDKDPHHHDVAILITRKDICSRENKPCSTLGVAHVSGMCQPDRSCNINEDNGITLAHTIAHELGHNFGMYHDAAKTGCVSRQGSTLHVMTPIFEADSLNIAWSDCSRRQITHFLDQGLGSCLEDPPDSDVYSYPELPPGAMYNADYQCKLQFGPDSSVCVTEEICSRLWCKMDGMCTSNLYPAAPGTHCGKHMWCVDQECVPIRESATPIPGGWGEWGEWSPCSRSCGIGVSIRERLCDHPVPAFGGTYCLGERRRYKICNSQPCPESPHSFRAEQCSAFNENPYFGKNYTWLPYYELSEPCQLYCTEKEGSLVANLGEYVFDGTPCNIGSNDVCIAGICHKVGCDWMVDSDADEDKCGVCLGDGQSCSTHRGYYNVTSGEGYQEITMVPRGARNILLEELQSSHNKIAVSDADGTHFYINSKGKAEVTGEYKIASGGLAFYKRHKDLEKLRIPGPTQEDLVLYVVFYERNPGVYFEWTVASNDAGVSSAQYQWQEGEWSTCSATCGGGQQVSKPVCREAGLSVDAGKCEPKLRPSDAMRMCNLHPCPVRWWVGPWQLCPVTCGQSAKRRRSVICVSGATEMALPDTHCEGQARPHDEEPCPHLPPCFPISDDLLQVQQLRSATKSRHGPDKWRAMAWSQCSVTCGLGFKKRTVFCASHSCDVYSRPISVKQCYRHCYSFNEEKYLQHLDHLKYSAK